ncbi:acyltransferase family protein [Mycolicibacterium sp. CH28]|uniref:lysophospholipid acyltransferase family protein n=1 Tax=Mycolicibacterium sp. CH28 TaxID=2512237 RepID=UPI001080B25B|nr:lysophospholipid acyltransferase family protein [Mycolicibacterium sp. CH28]TGD84735.1 acyltransferase family protein [Mycolicibacterium sp. CH28]
MNALSNTAQLVDQPPRVKALRRVVDTMLDAIAPLVDASLPYVDGIENLPRDGRFLLVGNHTQTGMAEAWLTSLVVRQAIGARVRPLAVRDVARMPGPLADLAAAYGPVVGSPENARELMAHGETVLVFPGGGREIGKFKGEEYRLNWEGRSGFARVAIANHYPIIPVGHVGGDDIYHSVATRDSAMGKAILAISAKLTGRPDMFFPLVRGAGPTLIPSPQRMYLRFGAPIDTTTPAGVSEDEWIAQVKKRTQTDLETILANLLEVRAHDPYRSLNPLARHRAT